MPGGRGTDPWGAAAPEVAVAELVEELWLGVGGWGSGLRGRLGPLEKGSAASIRGSLGAGRADQGRPDQPRTTKKMRLR